MKRRGFLGTIGALFAGGAAVAVSNPAEAAPTPSPAPVPTPIVPPEPLVCEPSFEVFTDYFEMARSIQDYVNKTGVEIWSSDFPVKLKIGFSSADDPGRIWAIGIASLKESLKGHDVLSQSLKSTEGRRRLAASFVPKAEPYR